MSTFLDLRSQLTAEVDAFRGESLEIRPQRASTYTGAIDDPDRPPVTIIGVLFVGRGEALSPTGGRSAKSWSSRLAAQEIELRVDPRRHPGVLTARTGDHVVSALRGRTYEISRIDPDQTTRHVLQLTELP